MLGFNYYNWDLLKQNKFKKLKNLKINNTNKKSASYNKDALFIEKTNIK